MLLQTVSILALGIVATGGSAGQSGPSDSQSHVSFDVASVRFSSPDTRGSYWNDHPGRMTITGGTLAALLQQAFGIWDYQISGPSWLHSRRYDIAAEMPPTTTRKERNEMIQSLLADRFHLAFHWEQKVLPVYVLEVAKGGPNMQLATPDGKGQSGTSSSRGRMKAENSSMAEFANDVSRYTGRGVIDETGLKGGYNFELRFTPDDGDTDLRQGQADSDSGPSIFTAVKEQLGLKLVSAKRPLQILVVDRIEETPTEN